VEPNDTPLTANPLAPMRCGTVGGKDQSDFLTFTLQSKTTTMQILFTGQVRLRVTINGSTTSLTPDSQNAVPFVKNQPYLIEVQPLSGNAAVPWTVTIVEK
jgi:hypothetical protein